MADRVGRTVTAMPVCYSPCRVVLTVGLQFDLQALSSAYVFLGQPLRHVVARSSIHRDESLPGHLPQVTVAGSALNYDLGGPAAMFESGDRVAKVRPRQLRPAQERW